MSVNVIRIAAPRRLIGSTAAALVVLLAGCAASTPAAQRTGAPGGASVGIASYYAAKYHGRTTASGETFDNGKLTAAHRTLPFGTTVRVTNLTNGRSVTVRVN